MKRYIVPPILTLLIAFFTTTVFSQPIIAITALLDKGDADAALTKINAALKTKPNDQALLTQKVRALVIKKQYAETETLANRLLTRDPKNKIALNARGVAKRDGTKDYPAALADFDKALALDPEYPQAAFNRALTLYGGKIGKKSETLDALSLTIELNPDNVTARAIRGQLLNGFGRYKLALSDFNKAIPINVYAEKAYAEMFLGMTSNALADAETALKLDPQSSLALAIRAYCRYSTANDKNTESNALADAQKALQIDPNNYIALMVIGFDKKLAKKDNAGALANFAAAYKLKPTNDWVVNTIYSHLNGLPELVKQNPENEKLLNETSKAIESQWREKIELKKLAISEDPWDFSLFESLDETWKKFRSFLSRDVRSNVGTPAWKAEQKAEYDFWVQQLGKDPKNYCVGYFRGLDLDLGSDGLYNANNKTSDGYKLNYLKGQLSNYDGKNGAECAARLALWIAEIYQTPYSTEKNFDLAKQFAQRSKEIKSDLKDDPNTISGIASTAQDSLSNIQYWEAEDNAWKKELEDMKQRGAAAANSRSGGRRANVDPAKEQAAISAYDRVHPQIERLAEQIVGAATKVQGGGQFSNFYTGTRARMSNLQSQMWTVYDNFMKVHGDYLPDSLSNHLKSDVRRVGNLRNDYVTGEAYNNYSGGNCSGGWSGYGC